MRYHLHQVRHKTLCRLNWQWRHMSCVRNDKTSKYQGIYTCIQVYILYLPLIHDDCDKSLHAHLKWTAWFVVVIYACTPTITIFSLTFIYKSEIHNIFVNNESLHVKFAWGCACCLETVLQNENVFSFLFYPRTWHNHIFFYSALFITDIFL